MEHLFFYLCVSLIGFFAQLVDGTLGMGYGVSSSFLLALGLYPAVVSASVHTAEIATSFISGISHFKLGNTGNRKIPLGFGFNSFNFWSYCRAHRCPSVQEDTAPAAGHSYRNFDCLA